MVRGDAFERLSKIGFLARLPRATAQLILETATQVQYPAGSYLFLGGDRTHVCLVVSGLLRYYLMSEHGREITIRYLGAGGLAGSIVRGESGVTTGLQVIEPAMLLYLDVDRVTELAGRDGQLAMALLEEATERLRQSYLALVGSAFGTVRSRVARDLMQRHVSGGTGASGRVLVTQQDLADATGSVREVVARALAELREDGIIATDRRGISILDFAGLKAASNAGDARLDDLRKQLPAG